MNTSLKKFSIVLKQEGTSRQERYVPQLHETNTLLDDRKLQDLILYMQRYSKNLLFIDPEKDSIDYAESWEDFFANDPVLLISTIASLNTKKIKEDYDHLTDIFTNFPNIGNFAELAKYVLSRFVEINKWYTLSETDSLINQDLSLYIRSYLQKEIENVKETILYCFDHLDDDTTSDRKAANNIKNEKSRHDLQSMDAIWKLDPKDKLSLREKLFSGNDEKEKLTNASIILNKIFQVVFYATENIVERSGNYFDETIHHQQNHKPHVALIITFIKLFHYQQLELNKIPQRLLSFYYKQFLGIKEKSAVPDQAYIIFELAKGFDTCFVKKGTKLSAGKDKLNHELTYATDKDIVLNKAKVSVLRTAYIERNQTNEIVNYYTDTITSTPGVVTVSGNTETKASRMFGTPAPQSVAETGFAIASSQFYLAKGKRNVVIKLYVSGDVESPEIKNNGKGINDFDTAIIKLFLTGEKGWINSDSEDSGITIDYLRKVDNSIIELSFSISIAQAQAIIAFDKKLHEGNFNTGFPIVKCVLKFPSEKEAVANADERIHQLNVLQQLQISSADITIQVGTIQTKINFDGVRDLILENDESVLDAKKPFYPFTPIPKVNSSFYIGCNDLFYKQIQALSINIEWILPDNFRSYYQKYNPPYDANKFMASLGYLEKNRWKKYSDIALIDVNTSEPRYRIIKLNLEKNPLPEDGVAAFDSIRKNGTIKLKLSYPDFGHNIYPQLLTSTLMDKAKSGNVDYYKLIKARLHDDIFTIELPADIEQRNGPLKVIYDILSNFKDDPRETGMLINALSDIISKNNDVVVVAQKPGQSAGASDEKGSQVIVHDQNFIEKFLRIFRKINVVSDRVHDDKDKEGVGDIVENLEKDIYKVADFILPSEKEMNSLIINEVNKNINQTVANAVQLILDARVETGIVDTKRIAKILNDEFEKARKVVNDMIAKRIAISLSANEIPPPPYSPLIKSISLNYTSAREMSCEADDKIFHLTLTGGITETNIWKDDRIKDAEQKNILVKTNYILPQQIPIISEAKHACVNGMLFIGITDIMPDQNLSLLFQVAEGTKSDDRQPPTLYWFYMKHNDWVPLKKDNIISDSTHELQTTGIIEFGLPADANNTNTFFNIPSLYWLCVGVAANTDSFPLLADVKAQAAGVTFTAYVSNPQHLALPLEAERIKKVIDELPQVKKISQPLPSFNGKVDEKDSEYYIRVSERLKHKSRAINNWDYESMVLEAFPSIFKVKCLNNYYNGHFAAGHVTVVPIADLRNKSYAGNNILVPKTNYIDLKRIEEFLCSRASPFVKVHALNPKLEHVLINCKVKFYAGADKGFYLKKLNEDLIKFLSPWIIDSGKISFSGKVYVSSIINFIDKRDYVDYVTDLVMFQYTEDEKGKKDYVFNAENLASLVETEVSTDHSILVSAPRHQIELVE